MRLTKKEQIIDNYAKDIKDYLHIGLCEGQANGSFGEDLIEHFDIMVNSFKETTRIEDELGIDLVTLFKALKNGVYVKEGSGKIKYYNPDQIAVNWVGYYPELVFLNTANKGDYCALNTNAYKLPYTPTWALTREELL